MAKKKVITTKAVEQEEFNPEPIEAGQEEHAAVVKAVAKKKGLSSFGSILAAANAKRKERKKQYGKED